MKSFEMICFGEMQVNRITPEVERSYSTPEADSFGYGFEEWVMKRSTNKKFYRICLQPRNFLVHFPGLIMKKILRLAYELFAKEQGQT